jgi:predicted RNase H-like HicB family nuclease
MHYYVAIIEDPGPELAIGVWFPDLPGCFSAGDSVAEAMENAPVAIAAYAEALEKDGKSLPPPRSVVEIRHDPNFADDVRNHIVALVPATEAAAVT